MNTLRRQLIISSVFAALALSARGAQSPSAVEVCTAPGCGCCHDWVKHLEANGFRVTVHDGGNTDARARLGMPVRLGSCHTAEVGGYAIEGHVPAREIRRLLKEKPQAVGLAVPAMPRGSPGMDGPAYNGQRDPYDVLLVQRDGGARVYQAYR
ncbi:MAG TPA: DUF411 domain-containing protein [Albitalea sp.]|nr:DUF411 domain-containing protein [Albitalea sp.]